MTIKKLKNSNLKGFKLILASTSYGNVGQLSADILINSLQVEKYALFYHKAIIPIIGPSAFNDNPQELSTASEIFVSEKNKIVLLQIRSPVTAYFMDSLCEEIIEFVKTEDINEVIQLSSAFSFEQHNVQQSPFAYVASNDYKTDEKISSLFNKSENPKIPGCGIAIKLHEFATEKQVPSIIFYKYVSEGDNSFDSIQFAGNFVKLLENPISEKDLKIPISWKHLFGHNVNPEIY